jgi:hypothetical protein
MLRAGVFHLRESGTGQRRHQSPFARGAHCRAPGARQNGTRAAPQRGQCVGASSGSGSTRAPHCQQYSGGGGSASHCTSKAMTSGEGSIRLLSRGTRRAPGWLLGAQRGDGALGLRLIERIQHAAYPVIAVQIEQGRQGLSDRRLWGREGWRLLPLLRRFAGLLRLRGLRRLPVCSVRMTSIAPLRAPTAVEAHRP